MARRVGDYELVRRIGSGGMAEVWMGRRAAVGGVTKSVAIKFMATGMAGSERHRRMFIDEAKVSMLMSHSNVVQVFDVGSEGNQMYMVMEWVDGLNLAQLCQLLRGTEQRWSFTVTGYVIGEILRALSYAHTVVHEGRQLGIVHRDISPQNVLVSVSGEVKLADFGVARLAVDETSGVHIKGKLRYMAPEHLAGRSKTPSVDLFGAGAILHELLSGEKFRTGADEMELYHLILGGHMPTLEVPDVPPELEQLRRALLEPDEQRRIPSADAALELLESWPGYRSAAGELSRLCRSFMGVQAPRSGIHQQAVVETGTGTTPGTDSTSTWSAGGPVGDPTPVERSVPRLHDEGSNTSLLPQPGGDFEEAPRRGRGALLIAAILGGGAAIGGGTALAFALLREPAESKPTLAATPVVEATQEPTAPVDPAPTGPRIEAAEPPVDDAPIEAPKVEAAAEPQPAAAPEPEQPTPPETVAPAASPSRRPRTNKQAAKTPQPQPEALPPAKISFRLKSPLRTAYVRIDGGSGVPVDPVAQKNLKPGSRRIDWKKSEDGLWISGGTFDFESGRSYTVRLTSTGPRVEQ